MPLTPSIGLSVLVHLIVLIISGLRRLFRSKLSKQRANKRDRRTRSPALVSRFLGMMIPFTISIVIFSGAFKLVELALKNRFSSIHLAQRYIATIQADESVADNNIFEPPQHILGSFTGPALVKNISALETNVHYSDCPPLFNDFANEYNWSVVNYLVEKETPYTIAAREVLARQLGVDGYNGSDEKNVALLQALYLKDNYEILSDQNACDLSISNN